MRLLCVFGLLLMCATGCATLTRGESQKMKFDTDPQGATVMIGDKTYTTPSEIPLMRKDVHKVTISKPGFRPVEFELKSTWDGASIPNAVLPGGSLMMAADRKTGADLKFYKLETVKLIPVTGSTAEPLVLKQHRGKLYTEAEYGQVMEEERKYRESKIFE